MPITTAYSLRTLHDLDVPEIHPGAATVTETIETLVLLRDGGFALFKRDNAGTNAVSLYDVDGRRTGGWETKGDIDAADQLASGDFVVAEQGGTDVGVGILDGNTGAFLDGGPLGDPGSHRPAVAGLSNGGYVIATRDFERQVIQDFDIDVRTFDPSNTPFGDFLLGSPLIDLNEESDPSLAGLENGNIAVAWRSDNVVLFGVYDQTGAEVRAPFRLGSSLAAPVVAAEPGGFVVAWQEGDFISGTDIYFVQVDLAGRLLRRIDDVSDLPNGSETLPTVTALADGLFAVSFLDASSKPYRIVTNIIDANGDTVATLDSQGSDPSDEITRPQLAAAGLGRFALAFDNVSTADVEGEFVQLVRTVTGDAAANTLSGTDLADVLHGLGGPDRIAGGQNDDFLSGGDGGDFLSGGPGADVLSGGPDSDTLDGGDGSDIATYIRSGAAVFVDLARGIARGGEAAGDRLVSIERLLGSRFDDVLLGDQAANVIDGSDGSDRIDGRAGDDSLAGGAGNDVIAGGPGADLIVGGPGTDFADYTNSPGRVIVSLSTGRGAGNDAAGDRLSTVEALVGSRFGDRLIGNPEDNRLLGAAGNDALIGGPGNDQLAGGPGRDTLNGGVGSDVLNGGGDGDFFRYARGFGRDTVVAFENDVDNLLLDDALWGGGLSVGQVLGAFGAQKAPNIVELGFGGDDVLTVFGPGLTLAQLQDDILIV